MLDQISDADNSANNSPNSRLSNRTILYPKRKTPRSRPYMRFEHNRIRWLKLKPGEFPVIRGLWRVELGETASEYPDLISAMDAVKVPTDADLKECYQLVIDCGVITFPHGQVIWGRKS